MLCDVLTCSVQLGAEGGDPVGQAALSLSLSKLYSTNYKEHSIISN